MTFSSNDDLFSFSLARTAINDFLLWENDSLKKTCDSSLKTSLTWTHLTTSSTSSAKFNLSVLKVKRLMQKLITDWSFASSSMIKNTLQTKCQQKRFEILWATNTKRSYKSLKDNIWWTLSTTKCRWIFLLKKHEHILSSWLERLLQHRMTWAIYSSQNVAFKSYFNYCQMNTQLFEISLMCRTSQTLKENFKSYKRKKHNWKQQRLCYKSSEKMNVSILIESRTNAKSIIVANTFQTLTMINHVIDF